VAEAVLQNFSKEAAEKEFPSIWRQGLEGGDFFVDKKLITKALLYIGKQHRGVTQVPMGKGEEVNLSLWGDGRSIGVAISDRGREFSKEP